MTNAEILDAIDANIAFLDDERATIVTAVRALVGLNPGDAAYQAALYPFDVAAEARRMALRQSGCGLATEVGWRAAGVEEPVLYRPYAERVAKGGREYAVALERADAALAGAWVDCTVWDGTKPYPLEGDAVIIGCAACRGTWAKGTFKMEHEFTVALWDDDGLMHSVDGGQPGIRLRTRALVEVPGRKEL